MTFEIVTAMSGENAYVLYGMGAMSLELYRTEDRIYAKFKQNNKENWTYAPIESKKDIFSIGKSDTSVRDEDIASWIYEEEVTENGIVYDKLKAYVRNEEGTFTSMVCWVNRETQKIDKYTTNQDGVYAEFVVEDIDGIVLPSAAQAATPTTVEEIAASLATLLLLSAWESSSAQ